MSRDDREGPTTSATGTLSLLSVGWNAESEEARMGLSRYKVAAGLAVSDMDRAREFYEGKLGLSVGINSGDNVQYRCAEGTVFHVYLSPEHAGKSTATLAALPKSQLAILPGTTHATLVERGEWLASMIGEFLDAPMPEAERTAGSGA